MNTKKLREIGKTGKKAVIDDVAQVAGVSKATVSRVMNKPHLVNVDTVKAVRDAMAQLDYEPNAVAQSMRLQKTKTMGVITPDLKNPFYSGMLSEIGKAVHPYGYLLLICPTSGDFGEEKDYISRVIQRRVDGILLFTYNNSQRHIEEIQSITKKLPFILMDEPIDELHVNQVITNGYAGVMKAVDYFVEKGHTRIACIHSKTEAASKRLWGYKDGLKKHDIEYDKKLAVPSGFSAEDGKFAARQLLKLEDRPTAIVCVADSIAVGVLKQFYASGINVPNEIEVIGFDNSDLSTITTPSISTVGQNIPVLAEQAVKLMMGMIDMSSKSRTVNIIKVEAELFLRDSTL